MAGAVMVGVQVLDMAANHLDGPIGELANYAMKPLTLFNQSVFRIFSNPAFQSGWRNKGPPRQPPPPEFNPFVDEATQFSNYWNDTQIALTNRLRNEAEQSLRDRLNFRLQVLQERRQALTESRTLRDIRKHNNQLALTQPQLQEYQGKIDEVIKVVDNNIEICQKHIIEADQDILNYEQSIKKPVDKPEPLTPKNKPIPKVQLLEPEPVQLLEEYNPQLFNKSSVIVTPFDNIAPLFGKKNISIFQFGVDGGLKINISSKGIISVVNPGSGYVTGISNNAGGTRFNLVVNKPNIISQPEPKLLDKPIKVSKPKPEPKLKDDPNLKPAPVVIPKPEPKPTVSRRG